MYDSFFNQAFQLSHYIFSFALLFIVIPRLLLPQVSSDNSERFFADLICMVALYISAGYFLVITKLFEVLGILALMAIAVYWRIIKTKGDSLAEKLNLLEARFYDLLDSGYNLKKAWERIRGKNAIYLAAKKSDKSKKTKRFSWKRLYDVPLLFVLGASSYVRFYDAVHYAAPPLSDAYVTLEWMKLVIRRLLFETGIYPQGFHITMAYIQKFSSIDPLYVLKYSGPLCGLLIVYGLYVTVSRLTGSRGGGVIAAAIYGIGGEALLPSDWERQASTNSQEFAFLFVLPTTYFTFRYMENGEKKWLWTSLAGYTVIGFVHSFAYGYAVMGAVAVALAFLLTNREQAARRVAFVAGIGALSATLSMLPIGIGLLLGKKIHSTSQTFLTEKVTVPLPQLSSLDIAGLIAIAVLLAAAILSIRNRTSSTVYLFGAVFGLATFSLYEFGATITHSLLIATRSSNLWAITQPFCAGMACSVLFRLGGSWRGVLPIEAAISLASAVLLAWSSSLTPVSPYKMQWESEARQFLKISEQYRPKTWMVITSHVEGYSLSLGNGYHQYIEFLYESFDPAKPFLTRWNASDPDIVTENLFLVYEKEIFRISKSLSIYSILGPKYEEREIKIKKLADWLHIYLHNHPETETYFEDDQIIIYRMFPKKKGTDNQRIWGDNDKTGKEQASEKLR